MGELVFVDSKGGALASLAASLASSRRLAARAESTAPIADRPEVAAVLSEIGVTKIVAPKPRGEAGTGDTVVLVGDESKAHIKASLYEGPDKTDFGDTALERASSARIARDRIERWLDARTE